MSNDAYRLTLELEVPAAVTPDRVARLLREIPVPGTGITITAHRAPHASLRAESPSSEGQRGLWLVAPADQRGARR